MNYLTGVAALALGGVVAMAPATSQANVRFETTLTGAEEVGGGDPDGSGFAHLELNSQNSMITWHISVENIVLPLTGAHIHEAPAGVNGPIVIDFMGALNGGGLFDPDVLRVIDNPANFYVNVHNAVFPGGAIRGQLGDDGAPSNGIPEPASAALLGLALGILGWRRRRG